MVARPPARGPRSPARRARSGGADFEAVGDLVGDFIDRADRPCDLARASDRRSSETPAQRRRAARPRSSSPGPCGRSPGPPCDGCVMSAGFGTCPVDAGEDRAARRPGHRPPRRYSPAMIKRTASSGWRWIGSRSSSARASPARRSALWPLDRVERQAGEPDLHADHDAPRACQQTRRAGPTGSGSPSGLSGPARVAVRRLPRVGRCGPGAVLARTSGAPRSGRGAPRSALAAGAAGHTHR